MASNSSNGGGIGFVGLLTVSFIVLKLTHAIDWSWWWVLAPLWLPALIAFSVFAVASLLIWIRDK